MIIDCIVMMGRNYHLDFFRLDDLQKVELMRRGVQDFSDIKGYRCVKILGQHFRSGNWGKNRCGSVATTMVAGISRYCILDRFFTIQRQIFALVTWLSVPTYPYAPNPLLVKVRFPPVDPTPQPSRILPVDRIIPTHVAVLPDDDGVNFWVMRGKGTDRTAFTQRTV